MLTAGSTFRRRFSYTTRALPPLGCAVRDPGRIHLIRASCKTCAVFCPAPGNRRDLFSVQTRANLIRYTAGSPADRTFCSATARSATTVEYPSHFGDANSTTDGQTKRLHSPRWPPDSLNIRRGNWGWDRINPTRLNLPPLGDFRDGLPVDASYVRLSGNSGSGFESKRMFRVMEKRQWSSKQSALSVRGDRKALSRPKMRIQDRPDNFPSAAYSSWLAFRAGVAISTRFLKSCRLSGFNQSSHA